MSDKKVIQLENISKTYRTSSGRKSIRSWFINEDNTGQQKSEIKALSNVSFSVSDGEFVGVIGRNGSGKSTLLHIISGAYPPDPGGKVSVEGRTIRLSLGMGFNNELTAGENIRINASLLGLTFDEIYEVYHPILEFAEVARFERTKVKYFSKGMRTRLAFSVALYTKTDILLMDEVFGGVGDSSFRKKANRAFKERILHDRTTVLVTHNANILRKFADRVLLFEQGKLVNMGSAEEMLKEYRLLNKDLEM